MFSVALVFLSVFLSVTNITKKKYNEIAMKLYGGVQGAKRNVVRFLVAFRITMLTVQSEIQSLFKQLVDFEEIFRIALQWCKEKLIELMWSRSPLWLS